MSGPAFLRPRPRRRAGFGRQGREAPGEAVNATPATFAADVASSSKAIGANDAAPANGAATSAAPAGSASEGIGIDD
ncbi:MAG: hypothetical protein D6757_03545, partial [Alphaproteobacteria bacterium]